MTNETQAQHTPGPWFYDEFIYAANGLRIADLYCEGQDEMPEDEVDANAAFIVRAVNSHDALLEVCNNLLVYALSSNRINNEYANEVRAALALAERGAE